jgi:hypothetical protein
MAIICFKHIEKASYLIFTAFQFLLVALVCGHSFQNCANDR